MRWLPIPRLRDRQKVLVAVVVEGDHAGKGVGDVRDLAERVVVDREVVPVAVFYFKTAILIIDLSETQSCAISRLDHQGGAIVSQTQIRQIRRIVNVGSSNLAKL